jgi:hypothetical protein
MARKFERDEKREKTVRNDRFPAWLQKLIAEDQEAFGHLKRRRKKKASGGR